MGQAAEAYNEENKETFRDSISTVDKDGNRVWVYPKKPKGKLTTYRNLVSYLYFILFFSGPFLKIDGEPVLLLNILERKFILFGKIFWPQDFHLFLLAMIAGTIFIVLFTVVFGRIFCGWICPQTIFMEMLFRKVEYWIEGDYKYQKALDKAPLSKGKILKKTFKHFIFVVLSMAIANTFLTYIIGVEKWLEILSDPISEHFSGFIAMVVFTIIFYWIYARFREQACTVVCPYGRLQGVLLDKNSIVVAYDYIRGERRAKIRKNEDRQAAFKGDCIDCYQCVDVCPTGIDIRNGTQLECINCTACIDACNFMMQKVGLAEGLIRYASEKEIAEKKKFKVTTRIIGYSTVLILLLVSIVFLLFTRSDIETTVLRTPGILYQEQKDNMISNLYNVKIINKTNKAIPIHLAINNGSGKIKMVGKGLVLNKQGVADGAFFIYLNKENIKESKTKISIDVYSGDKLLETIKTTFIGPVN